MSIEKLIEAHTAALQENTNAIERLIEAHGGAEAPAKAASKPAAKAASKPAAKPKADDGPTDDDFKKVLGDYLKGAADEDGRNERKLAVQKLFKQFGVTKAGELAGKPEGHELIDAIADLAEQGDDDLV